MEKRLFTVREIHLLVDELLRAIEYTTEEHVDDTDQKIQAGENEKLTLTVTEAAELKYSFGHLLLAYLPSGICIHE